MAIFHNKRALIEQYVTPESVVLDVGFWGQGVDIHNPEWVHHLLKSRAKDVYGLDMVYDLAQLPELEPSHYQQTSAEDFSFNGVTFDIIFAGDLIEHLSNPGQFLAVCAQHLAPGGKLIITTPNCFNLFNLTEKLTKSEPTLNYDHTCYFNAKTLKQLLKKNNWETEAVHFIYTLELQHRESLKKKFLNGVYKLLSLITPKFVETLVVVATRR
jgi:2-polyprenyl-3-methyl-5-hydroxy-6-metoxy-1,4-benzoquinol methylase